MPLERVDLGRVAEKIRLPLARVAADEAVEVVEAHADRPLIEWPKLARLERWRVVVLAEPTGGVAVVLENAADSSLVLGNNAIVARKAGRLLRNHAEAGRVMVAAGDQRRAGGRTKRGRVHAGVAEPGLGHAIQGRRRNHAAKGGRHAVARVIGHDQQHVRRFFGRHDPRRPPCLRLHSSVLDHATESRVGRRQLLAADRGRSAGRAQLSGDLWGRSLRRLGRVAFRRDSSRTAKQLGRTHRQQAQHQGDRQSSHKRLAVTRSPKNLFPSLHRQCPFHTGKYGVRLNLLRVQQV